MSIKALSLKALSLKALSLKALSQMSARPRKTRRDLRRLGPPGRQRLVDRVEFDAVPERAA